MILCLTGCEHVAPDVLFSGMMTLLREIQIVLERTYGETGVDFGDFLVTRQHSEWLASMADTSTAQISELGRVFLRISDGRLRLGIHYAPSVIEALERNNPQHSLNDDNILPFMVFVEELDHAVHAALKFQRGSRDIQSETFVRDLELQAKVDVYLVLRLFCAKLRDLTEPLETDRRWMKACVFDAESFSRLNPLLAARYRETNRYARRYVTVLERLDSKARTAEIRRFHRLSYPNKLARIRKMAGPIPSRWIRN